MCRQFFLELSPLKYCIKVQEKNNIVLVFCSSSRKREIRHFLRGSRATTATKCTKKRDARYKLLFCQTCYFLPFLSPSSFLKLPIMKCAT